MNEDRRSDSRRTVDLIARCHFGPSKTANVRVSNLSTDGCKIAEIGRHYVQQGDRVSLRIGGIQGVSAQVVWVHLDEAGLQFDTPLHASVADHLLYGQNPTYRPVDSGLTDRFGRPMPKLNGLHRKTPAGRVRPC